MKFLKPIFVLIVSMLALLLTGCAGLPSGMEAPTVTIADFGAGGGGFFEQQFNLKLRVQNPNNSELKIDGFRALAYLERNQLRLVSRNQNDLTAEFPELRELATHGDVKGDTTTLEDLSVIAKLRDEEE